MTWCICVDRLALPPTNNRQPRDAKTALLVLADQTEQVNELTGVFENADGAAKEMADTQLNTLGGSIKLLTSAWEGFILKMNDASGASSGLTYIIKFLATNLETIFSIIGKGIIAWGAYRAAILSAKSKQYFG